MKKLRHNGVALSLVVILLIFFAPQSVFAYQAAPFAVTMPAMFITEKSAQINGQANPSDMPDAYSWFEWGISGRMDIVYETPHQGLSGQNILINTNATIIGLAPNTQYFYRQIAENGRGRDTGQTVFFTTKPLAIMVPPLVIVETISPLVVTDTTATLKGYVSPHGDRNTKAWFQWGFSQNFENQTPASGVSSDAGPIESPLNNLTPGTTYFYRVVGENTAGRTFGTTRMFLTTGIPPPPPEQPISQAVPIERASDGVARNTTTSGAPLAQASSNNSGDGTYGLPGISSGNRPGDIWGAFFKKKTPTNNSGVSTQGQVAGVAGSVNPLWGFLGNLIGQRSVQVTIENIGPKNVVAHTPVEYRITYVYQSATPGINAKLKIILPSDVIYIGDNTNNELLLEEGGSGERTYILPIGRIEKGTTRTLSVLGMTTGDAIGFPSARARFEYDGANGTQVVAATSGALVTGTPATKSTASTANSGGWLPSSFFGWILYLMLIVLSIIGVRKAKIYYQKRKAMIESQEGENERGRLAQLLPESNGTPQGA